MVAPNHNGTTAGWPIHAPSHRGDSPGYDGDKQLGQDPEQDLDRVPSLPCHVERPDTGGAPSSGWLSEGAAGLQGGWLRRTCCGKGTCCVVGASSTDDTSRGLAVSGVSSERVVDWLDSCYGGGWAAGHCGGWSGGRCTDDRPCGRGGGESAQPRAAFAGGNGGNPDLSLPRLATEYWAEAVFAVWTAVGAGGLVGNRAGAVSFFGALRGYRVLDAHPESPVLQKRGQHFYQPSWCLRGGQFVYQARPVKGFLHVQEYCYHVLLSVMGDSQVVQYPRQLQCGAVLRPESVLFGPWGDVEGQMDQK